MAKAKSAAAQRRPRSSRSLGGVASSAALATARRRRSLVVVDVDYSSEDNYLFSYLADEQSMGIFVRTLAPQPSGTHLILRFAATPGSPGVPVASLSDAAPRPLSTDRIPRLAVLDDDLEAELDAELEAELEAELGAPLAAELVSELKVEGEVIWVNSYRPSVKDNLHPGMGVRFLGVDAPTRARLLAMVGRFAYLT
jgi:hypothetical protein